MDNFAKKTFNLFPLAVIVHTFSDLVDPSAQVSWAAIVVVSEIWQHMFISSPQLPLHSGVDM